MIRFGCLLVLLALALLSATAGVTLAGTSVSLDEQFSFIQQRMRNLQAVQTVEALRAQISDLQKSLDELANKVRRTNDWIKSKTDELRGRGLSQAQIEEEQLELEEKYGGDIAKVRQSNRRLRLSGVSSTKPKRQL